MKTQNGNPIEIEREEGGPRGLNADRAADICRACDDFFERRGLDAGQFVIPTFPLHFYNRRKKRP